eukprot:CAMPEP_0180440042 /NCGR_PEP_ID=MMETSP1036_2-20121128/12902_1 /TAXON_ID=632150 /ORGANISM="Azadinium spinosum, Strain 3D9" /LENGTH=52 /DNA_ID=CAMNT_0022446205 /DNA_START=195 /DNA_END=353 /DNA_ORIENTATION=-
MKSNMQSELDVHALTSNLIPLPAANASSIPAQRGHLAKTRALRVEPRNQVSK